MADLHLRLDLLGSALCLASHLVGGTLCLAGQLGSLALCLTRHLGCFTGGLLGVDAHGLLGGFSRLLY